MTDKLAEEIQFWLKRAFLSTRNATNESLVELGLTWAQFDVLNAIWENNGIEQRALQEQLGLTPATLGGIIDGLVERKLVERRLSQEDARVKQLFLTTQTPQAQQFQQDLERKMAEVKQRLVQNFKPSELSLFRDWLRQLAHNFGDDTP